MESFLIENVFGKSTFEFEPEVLEALKSEFERTGLIMVGETHGVVQNYDVYAFLIRELGITRVGMELEDRLVGFLTEYDGENIYQIKEKLARFDCSDGRINTTLLDFILHLKNLGIEVFIFDNNQYDTTLDHTQNSINRDQKMARDISEFRNPNTLVFAGNYHTDSQREGSAAHFLSEIDGFVSCEIGYTSGQYLNMETRDFACEPNVTQGPIQLVQNAGSDSLCDFKFIIPVEEPVKLITEKTPQARDWSKKYFYF
jgi:hypothetical protein